MPSQNSGIILKNDCDKQKEATVQAILGLVDLFRTELLRLDKNLAHLEAIEAEFEKRSLYISSEAVSIQTSDYQVTWNKLGYSEHSLSSDETYRPEVLKDATVLSTSPRQILKSKSRQTLEAEIYDLPEFPRFNDAKQPSISLFPQWTTGLPEDFHPFIFHVICHLMVYKDAYHQKSAITHLLSQIPLEYYRIRHELRNGIDNYTIKNGLLALFAQVPDVEDTNSYQLGTGPNVIEDRV